MNNDDINGLYKLKKYYNINSIIFLVMQIECIARMDSIGLALFTYVMHVSCTDIIIHPIVL